MRQNFHSLMRTVVSLTQNTITQHRKSRTELRLARSEGPPSRVGDRDGRTSRIAVTALGRTDQLRESLGSRVLVCDQIEGVRTWLSGPTRVKRNCFRSCTPLRFRWFPLRAEVSFTGRISATQRRSCDSRRRFRGCCLCSRFAGSATPWIDAPTAQPTTQSSQWLSTASGLSFHSSTVRPRPLVLTRYSAVRCSENNRWRSAFFPKSERHPQSPPPTARRDWMNDFQKFVS